MLVHQESETYDIFSAAQCWSIERAQLIGHKTDQQLKHMNHSTTSRKSYPIQVFLLLFVVTGIIANFFIPNKPLLDERLFFNEVMAFGKQYLPSLEQISSMNSPMGPIYFIVYGFIGKLVQFEIFWMRIFHLFLSASLLFLVYKNLALLFHSSAILSNHTTSDLDNSGARNQPFVLPIYLTIVFFLNPYFVCMTGYLLYTDVIGLIFIFLGSYFYLKQKHLFAAAIFWGLAICTRQLLIVIPMAAFVTEAIHTINQVRKESSPSYLQLLKGAITFSIPFLLFIPLFILWDFNVNSGNFKGSQFEENTLEAFSFSFKSLNYSLILIGIYAGFALYKKVIPAFKKPNIYLIILTALLLVLGFPIEINKGMEYGNLPDTAGILDIILTKISFLSYILIPILLYWSLTFILQVARLPYDRNTLFLQLCLILFLALETIYSYCWDKHFMLVIPIIWLLCYQLLSNNRQPVVRTMT